MPQTRVSNRCFGFTKCAERDKVQTSVPDLLFKELIGDHRGLVPASFELHSEFDHRVDIACAADGRKKDIQRTARSGARALFLVLSC